MKDFMIDFIGDNNGKTYTLLCVGFLVCETGEISRYRAYSQNVQLRVPIAYLKRFWGHPEPNM